MAAVKRSVPLRQSGQTPTGISFDDCDKDILINFPLTLGGSLLNTSYHLEVWAGGSDCSPITARSNINPLCGKVYGSSVPRNVSTTVSIRARDIVAVVPATRSINYTAAGPAVCKAQDPNSPGATSVSIYFLWLDGSGNSVSSSPAYAIPVDLVGPATAGTVTVGDGDRILVVTIPTPSDPDIQSFTVYCDPVAGSDGGDSAADAGSAPVTLVCADGGLDDGGIDDSGDAIAPQSIDAGCHYEYVTEDGGGGSADCRAPTFQHTCGDPVGKTGGTIPVPATNGTKYTVAVRATDGFGNVGPASVPACATPGPVDDFWNQYRKDGGQAGGGYCALENVGAPARASIFALVTAAAALSFVRRRRRR